MTDLSDMAKRFSRLEQLERELNLRQLQVNRLLTITQAINNNVSAEDLYSMYHSFLSWELGVRKMALFVRQQEEDQGDWRCAAQIGLTKELLACEMTEELTAFTELVNLESSDHPFLSAFDLVIPVLHKQLPIAYVFITLFLVLSLWIFFFLSNFFLVGQSTLRTLFDWIPITFLIFVPAVTMRMWAEEQKLGTAEILLTFPVRDWEVVLGKFLAGLAFLAVAILLTLPLAGTIAWLGNPDDGAVIAGYIGSLFVGATYLAIGLWVSSLTQNQIVAFLISIIICFVLYIVGIPVILASLPDWLVPFVANLSLGSHYDSMGRGVIDSRDILYYVSIIFFFLFLNVQTIASRRWS